MSKNAQAKVSVVIPVFNEEKQIKACLDAIESQTKKPYEVIVVDNNSGDNTTAIANSYKRVKIIKEPKQGLSFARYTGLEKARGDILLRIDADTILPGDYIERLVYLFNRHPEYAGFSGYGKSRYEFIPKISIPWNIGYHMFVEAYLGYPVLWGANMAIRKKYWKRLKYHLLNDDNLVHEDQDFSIALASTGGKVMIVRDLVVSVQMEGMLHYNQYRRYGKMLKNLKKIDKSMPRYKLKRRLPNNNILKRILKYIASAPGVYGFYIITFIYTPFWYIKYWLKAH